MRKFILISALLLLAPSLRAADVQWPATMGNWTASATTEDPTPASASPVLQESGLVRTSSHTYRNGDRSLSMTLYTFRDSSGAYEAYTFLLGAPEWLDKNKAILLKSNLVLQIYAPAHFSADELKPFEVWEESLSDHIPPPPVASYLPDKDRSLLTERYALGPVGFRKATTDLAQAYAAALADVAGFDSGAEAMFARYEAAKNRALLLLIEYPTPQLAELHLRHLQRALHEAKLGTSSVERKGSLLSIVLETTSAEYAEKLRGAINYETEVTWNEPSTTATDPPITSTLVKIIIATMVLMGMAFVLGLAFGGVRVITKRLFPGKVFDRPAQMEVLQLGLSGKPIDPRDMY